MPSKQLLPVADGPCENTMRRAASGCAITRARRLHGLFGGSSRPRSSNCGPIPRRLRRTTPAQLRPETLFLPAGASFRRRVLAKYRFTARSIFADVILTGLPSYLLYNGVYGQRTAS